MMKRLTLVFAMCAVVSAAGASSQQVDVTALGPKAGQKALDFSLPGHDGKTYSLASAAGPKGTMLVFFRSADW
jgi:hypothetical protein